MTRQQAFDQVYRHFIINGGLPSYDESQAGENSETNGCFYRSPTGCRCAFGVLIPDALYDPSMEAKDVPQLLAGWPDLGVLFSDMHHPAEFLQCLQECHDAAAIGATNPGCSFLELIYDHLVRAAQEFGLTIPERA